MTDTNQKLSGNQKIDLLAVVTPNFRIWSGESVLRMSDIKLGQGGTLPPKKFASLGRKALINKDELLPFRQVKARFIRVVRAHGVPFLGGYAMHIDSYKQIKKILDGYVKDFGREIINLGQNYDRIIEEWIFKNPDYANSIRMDKKPVELVMDRFRAGYNVHRIQPLDDAQERIDLENAVEGLYERLIEETAKEAKDYLKRSLEGKVEVTQMARSVLDRIRTKLQRLSFLNSKISILAELLGRVDASLPQKGMLRGRSFLKMYSIMSTLSEPKTIEDVVAGKLPIIGLTANLQLDEKNAPKGLLERLCIPAPTEQDAEPLEDEQQGDLFLTYDSHENQKDPEPADKTLETEAAAADSNDQVLPLVQERPPAIKWF